MTSADNGRVDAPSSAGEITLVLGGGGARGLAHFGVLKVLEEQGIPFDRVVGNSAGALAAAVYLQCPDAATAIEKTLRYLKSPHFQRLKLAFRIPKKPGEKPPPTPLSRLLSGWRRQVAMHLLFRRPSLFHVRRLEAVVEGLVDRARIEDLRLPLGVVAVDLERGEEVVLRQGDLGSALLASCSVAGFFPPVEIDGRVLIDAGHTDNLPVQLARRDAHGLVVAVNLSSEIEQRRDFGTGIEIMLRAEEIGSRWNADLRARDADFVLAPRLDARYWLDFADPEVVVAAGEEAARAALPGLLRWLSAAAPTRGGTGSRILDPSGPSC